MNQAVTLPAGDLVRDPDMTLPQWAQYVLGRQARSEGYPLAACNMGLSNPMRGFWAAGWIDLDIEMGMGA